MHIHFIKVSTTLPKIPLKLNIQHYLVHFVETATYCIILITPNLPKINTQKIISCPTHLVSNCGCTTRSSSPPELCSQSNSPPASIPSVMEIVELPAINCPRESRSLHENPLNGSMSMPALPVGSRGMPCCDRMSSIVGVGGSVKGSRRAAADLFGCFVLDFLQRRRSDVAYRLPRLCGLSDVFCSCVIVPWIARRTPRSPPSLLIAPAILA